MSACIVLLAIGARLPNGLSAAAARQHHYVYTRATQTAAMSPVPPLVHRRSLGLVRQQLHAIGRHRKPGSPPPSAGCPGCRTRESGIAACRCNTRVMTSGDDRHAFRHKHDITTRATESCCTTTHMLVRPVQIASSATPMRRLSSKSWCQPFPPQGCTTVHGKAQQGMGAPVRSRACSRGSMPAGERRRPGCRPRSIPAGIACDGTSFFMAQSITALCQTQARQPLDRVANLPASRT